MWSGVSQYGGTHLVERQQAGRALRVDDEADAHQRHGHVLEEVAAVVARRRHQRTLVLHDGLHHRLQRRAACGRRGSLVARETRRGREGPTPTILVVDVELAEVAHLSGAAVAMGERAQRLQALGHCRREAALARQVRDQEDVLRGVHLVGAVRATWETS